MRKIRNYSLCIGKGAWPAIPPEPCELCGSEYIIRKTKLSKSRRYRSNKILCDECGNVRGVKVLYLFEPGLKKLYCTINDRGCKNGT